VRQRHSDPPAVYLSSVGPSTPARTPRPSECGAAVPMAFCSDGPGSGVPKAELLPPSPPARRPWLLAGRYPLLLLACLGLLIALLLASVILLAVLLSRREHASGEACGLTSATPIAFAPLRTDFTPIAAPPFTPAAAAVVEPPSGLFGSGVAAPPTSAWWTPWVQATGPDTIAVRGAGVQEL
jgi:hypothetical protein